jgi:hypothetical protein
MSPTIGLQKNTLYDVISDNAGFGDAIVGALSFEVSCGTLQSMTASWSASDSNYIILDWKYQNTSCTFSVPPFLPFMQNDTG